MRPATRCMSDMPRLTSLMTVDCYKAEALPTKCMPAHNERSGYLRIVGGNCEGTERKNRASFLSIFSILFLPCQGVMGENQCPEGGRITRIGRAEILT